MAEEERDILRLEELGNEVDYVADDETLDGVLGISDDEEAPEKSEVDDDEDGDEPEVDPLQQTGRKRKMTAAIWGTAAMKVDKKAQCLVCKQFYACARSNTSVIRTHVMTVHPGSEECKKFLALDKKMKEDKAKKQKPKAKVTMLDFISCKKPLTKSESEKMTCSVQDYLIQTNMSLSTVENPSFRRMLFTFHSGYVAPSRTTITANIDKNQGEERSPQD
jgi:hypothetical protein